MTLIIAYFFIDIIYSCSLSIADPLAREEWDKDTPELTEEEAMRLLEQGDQDTTETDREQPQDDGDRNNGGGESAVIGPRPTAGGGRDTSRKGKRRSTSPSESNVSKRTRNDSVSSAGSSRASSYLPPLYYSTMNKRDDAITPRVLGGGLTLLLRGD
jgi:hypothetical protein